MLLSTPIRSLLAVVLLAAPGLAVQADPVADLTALEKDLPVFRRAFRHQELLARYRELAESKNAVARRKAAERLAILTPEADLLARLGAGLERDKPARVLEKLAALPLDAREELALARLSFFLGKPEIAEPALGRARYKDPTLKTESDRMLAAARREAVPRGGYHRYRNAFYPLAVRDRARALDAAYDGLRHLSDIDKLRLPFAPDPKASSLSRYEGLGAEGPEFLREAAATVRAALRVDYREVRSWLASYRQQGLARRLLEQRAALAKVQAPALKLIRRYDKPQQPEVDAFRKQLEELYDGFEKLRERDLQRFHRVTPAKAFALRERIRRREAALVAIDGFLAAYAKPGIGHASVTPDRDAPVTATHFMPGRRQSELCDFLWLLVQHRAGLTLDVMARGADLLRYRKKLTPWEVLQTELMLADAIEGYNETCATSLRPVERQFMRINNRYRRILGLRPFEIEERLNVAARKHSQEMVDLGYFGHISPVARNRGPSDPVRLEGYNGGVGENCLSGSASAQGAFEGWYHSPGHHRNLISGGIHLGVGVASSTMWTMVAGGSDKRWRLLHEDLPPARRDELRTLAAELGRVTRLRTKKSRKRQRDAEQRAAHELPAILPYVARSAFAAASDLHHPSHGRFAALLGFVIDAGVGPEWRPLRIAAVAAGIESLRHSRDRDQRAQMFAILSKHIDETFGYDPLGDAISRADAVTKMRARWEDVAQWKFAGAAKPPVVHKLPGRVGDGPSLEAPVRVLTPKERLRLAKKFGGGRTTERAVDRGLEWLSKVQSEDGAWRGRSWTMLSPKFNAKSGIGSGEFEIAMTGLALLAFVNAGHTPAQGEYAGVVDKGTRFLLANIGDYGKFITGASHYMYNHAIATQALCELYAATADPYIGTGAQLAVDFLGWAQHRESGGWRYEANQSGDTSVTGWVVLALNSAHKARLDVTGFRDAMRFLDRVTDQTYYRVGYMNPGDRPLNSRLAGVAMVCRLFLGERKRTSRIMLPAYRIRARLPSKRTYDFYSWYYGSLGMFQLGDEFWKPWNDALESVLLDTQDTRPGSPLFGSWPPDPNHGRTGGRVYQTALGVLMLTNYYRYDRALKVRVRPFTGDIAKSIEPYLEALRTSGKDEGMYRKLVLNKMIDHFGSAMGATLIRTLKARKDTVELRRELAGVLGSVCESKHENMLLGLLDEPDAAILRLVLDALSRVSTRQSVLTLCQHLNHKKREVRAYAAKSLGRIADARAAEPLSRQLQREKDKWCRDEMQAALAKIAQRKSISTVVNDAFPGDTTGLLQVLDGLEVLQSHGIAKKLLAAREREPKLYERALAAVRTHREASAIAILIELLDSDDEPTRVESIKLLRALSGRRFGYAPKKSASVRRKAQQAWALWWRAHVQEFDPRGDER